MPGKRTERLDMPRQLRLDDELARDVRLIADLEGRPIGSQILRWIRSGVESYKASGRQPQIGRAHLSNPVTPTSPIPLFFFLMPRPPRSSPLFPSPPLSESRAGPWPRKPCAGPAPASSHIGPAGVSP